MTTSLRIYKRLSTERKCYYAVDTINNKTSWDQLSLVLDRESGKSKIAVFLPRLDYSSIPESIKVGIVFVSTVHGHKTPPSKWWPASDDSAECEGDIEFARTLFRLMPQWFESRALIGHPYELLPHALASVEEGSKMLRDGKVSGKKLLHR